MFTLAVCLALNPHPDLWLDDTAFALKYLPAEVRSLAAAGRELDELSARVAARGPVPPPALVEELRARQDGYAVQAGLFALKVRWWQFHLRANPTYRLRPAPGPATSGGP